MRYEIIDNKDHFILRDNLSSTSVEVFTFGALLNKFEVKANGKMVNVIDGYASVEDARNNVTQLHKSAKLTPFVCRLNAGKFSFNGKEFNIKKFNIGPSAIHGLVFDAEFQKSSTHVDDHKATVALHYDYHTEEHGFPFAFSVHVGYKLSNDNKLTVDTAVTNHSKETFPLSDGWHPYFKLGASINDADIKFNSKEMMEFSELLLPTGKASPYTEFNDFKRFGNKELDNCFTLNDFEQPAFVMKDNNVGVALSIYPDKSYPYLQIYTPPSRESIAVENLSSVPDAFNNKIGLIEIKPEETRNFITRYELSIL